MLWFYTVWFVCWFWWFISYVGLNVGFIFGLDRFVMVWSSIVVLVWFVGLVWLVVMVWFGLGLLCFVVLGLVSLDLVWFGLVWFGIEEAETRMKHP